MPGVMKGAEVKFCHFHAIVSWISRSVSRIQISRDFEIHFTSVSQDSQTIVSLFEVARQEEETGSDRFQSIPALCGSEMQYIRSSPTT